MSPQPLLEARKISYMYEGNRLPTLTNVDLSLFAGEVVAITGHSGCGKSTLLHILSGMITPESGDLLWEGTVITDNTQEVLARNTGIIFQAFHVVPYLTVEENLAVGSLFQGGEFARLDHLLEEVGLSEYKTKPVASLSGGQKQRVAIARALMKGAKLLFADEPTGNLDEETGQSILHLFHTLAKEEGCGVCYVTHELSSIQAAEAVYHMNGGTIKKADNP